MNYNDELNNMGGKLDTIRDILFGQQVQQYDSQFAEVQDLMRKQREELDERMMTLHKQLVDTLNALHKDLSTVIEQNRQYTQQQLDRIDYEKTNRKELGKLMVSLGQLLIQDDRIVPAQEQSIEAKTVGQLEENASNDDLSEEVNG